MNWHLVEELYLLYNSDVQPKIKFNPFLNNVVVGNLAIQFNDNMKITIPFYSEEDCLITMHELNASTQDSIAQLATFSVSYVGNQLGERKSTEFSDLNAHHSEKALVGFFMERTSFFVKQLVQEFEKKYGPEEVNNVKKLNSIVFEMFSTRDTCSLCECLLAMPDNVISSNLLILLQVQFPNLKVQKDDSIIRKHLVFSISEKEKRIFAEDDISKSVLTIDPDQRNYFNMRFLERLLFYPEWQPALCSKRTYFTSISDASAGCFPKSKSFEDEKSVAEALNARKDYFKSQVIAEK